MDAYMYDAAMVCETCGDEIREELAAKAGKTPSEMDEEGLDSGEWPAGPYNMDQTESDSPDHCDACGVFLENALTSEGYDYVKEAVQSARENGKKDSVALTEWAPFYDIDVDEDEDADGSVEAAAHSDRAKLAQKLILVARRLLQAETPAKDKQKAKPVSTTVKNCNGTGCGKCPACKLVAKK